MADETPEASAAPVETEQQPAPEQPKPKDEVPPEVKAALRKANKEAETLRLKLQEFEDRDKSEAQKLADRADAAEKRAADLEHRALRLEVAAEKGLTTVQAKRLVGSTREELEADADELLETFKPAAPPEPKVPGLDLGPRQPSGVEPTTPRERINAGLAQHMK